MKKKMLILVSIFTLVLMIGATSALATSYNSSFIVSTTLTGGTRSYQGGDDMGINCWGVSLTIPTGYELVDEPAGYKVTLYKGSTSQGTVGTFPIATSTWNGKWTGKGPGDNTLNYHYNFTAVNTKTTNNEGGSGYASIHGSCTMYSE